MNPSLEKPLVSVIIPTYNVADYVKEAIDSVLAQTYPAIEIIAVDNGSTDATREVLQPYIDKKMITYIRQENRGLAGARNTGIRNSSGTYIAFLDADDIFLPEKVERQVAYLTEHPECDVSYCDIWHFYDGKPENLFKLKYNYYSGRDVFPNLLKKNFINPLSVVMRRSAINRIGFFDESYWHGEDWEYWIRLSYRGVNFCHLPETLGKYRIWKGGKWYSPEVMIKDKSTAVRDFKNLRRIMSRAERKKYHMNRVLLHHFFRLWLVKIEYYFPSLASLHQRLQKGRLDLA